MRVIGQASVFSQMTGLETRVAFDTFRGGRVGGGRERGGGGGGAGSRAQIG